MQFLPLIIQLITGAVGGNAAGKLLKKFDLGLVGNSLAGILGGGIGGQLFEMAGIAAGPSGALDVTAMVGSLASGGVGGGVLMLVIGFIKSLVAKGQVAQR